MHRIYTLITAVFFLVITTFSTAQNHNRRSLDAVRVHSVPIIDGSVDDVVWKDANIATSFIQESPVYNTAPKFNTEVRVVYDNKAIYVLAVMYDPNPDSIMRELAVRDNDGKNADYFSIAFDTWNNHQDAYVFSVSASGTQIDKRMLDATYDAVWSSAVSITSEGWVAELKIPYSALRFPALKTQDWGMQISRRIRRFRGEDQWALEPRDTDNKMNFWGVLTGLHDINPPLRLSLLPYISAGVQHNSGKEYKSDPYTFNYNGGMDLKWGLNESFTLDMILMPDFSQVQSDRVEKNLSPFEQTYDEKRPFFNEGTDLFQKGNLFYSRRIGHVPLRYGSVRDSLRANERLTSNPYSARLINAAKVSGRTSSGLGIGVFNAITGNTYAVCSDSLNNKREILTDPLTNYNIIVLDQSLPNNSSVYLINTNVSRPDNWQQSNVIGGGLRLSEKSTTYLLRADFSMSSVKNPGSYKGENNDNVTQGTFYNLEFLKIKGKFRFSLYQIGMDKDYNRNDLGVNRTNDWLDRGLTLGYNIFQPFGIFRNFYQSINFFREEKITTGENINSIITYRYNTTFKNYLSTWGNISYSPFDRYDYYEPRTYGRYWINPGYLSTSIGISSDYRKKLAIDANFEASVDFDETIWRFFWISPILRISDRLKVSPELTFQDGLKDKGFVSRLSDTVYFGNRNISSRIAAISGEYMFTNKISLSLWVRHYWQTGKYLNYLYLTEKGDLVNYSNYQWNHDYNYNYFNVDLVFGWEFSPGSIINVVWKNAIEQEDPNPRVKYFRNFDQMISSPQINNLSLKVLYYIDYQMLKKRK